MASILLNCIQKSIIVLHFTKWWSIYVYKIYYLLENNNIIIAIIDGSVINW